MDRSKPVVSIGIPTYNRPEELRHSLNGIIGQTYKNLEIIISDNASPGDLTEEIVRGYMQRDSRIKYFRQAENMGPLFNYQFVLDKATGEFFMWAADDDYRAPTFVAVLVEQLHQCPECAISFCDFMEVDVNGVEVKGYPRHFPLLQHFASSYALIRLTQFYLQLESKGKANLIYGLIRRASLKDFKWNDFARRHGEYAADMLFVFSMLCWGRLALTDQRLYRCTVGNKKEYVAAAPLSFGDKLATPFVGLAKLLRYSAQYLLLAKGWIRVVLIMCWPIKAMDIVVRIFLTTEIMNLYMRVRRRFISVRTN